MAQKGTFADLNSADGYVSGLGLKKGDMEKAQEADAESVENEMLEKEAVIAKIASIKAGEAKSKEKEGPSRGRRNKDALLTYMKSMGGIAFSVFCAFTVGNIGFRSAQREFIPARSLGARCFSS